MAFVPIYILILGFTIVIDYFAGLVIEKSEGKRKKLFLIFSLIANIGVLAVFKYYNFINENLSFLCTSFGFVNHIPYLKILLPIGLSFHTFQAMSYTIEVYRGNQKAEKHFGIYALYVMFYPQLVAGPIERPQNILHQFYEKHSFNYDRVSSGLKLMLWGFFKKIVIADNLAIIANKIFNDVHQFHGLTLVVGILAFTIQIFCDFSGYSDIAIGAAEVMGFKLMTNFKRPYFSETISEFWSRWHISLSSWFKDYLYIPLGGNRVALPRWYFNLFFVFLISGLWHGANWTYIIWGALHGVYLVVGLITKKIRANAAAMVGLTKFPVLHKWLNIAVTFCLASFAWIFFRANSFSDAMYIVKDLAGIRASVTTTANAVNEVTQKEIHYAGYITVILCVFLMELVHFYQENYGSVRLKLAAQKFPVRWFVYIALFFAIILFGAYQDIQFIYFQF